MEDIKKLLMKFVTFVAKAPQKPKIPCPKTIQPNLDFFNFIALSMP